MRKLFHDYDCPQNSRLERSRVQIAWLAMVLLPGLLLLAACAPAEPIDEPQTTATPVASATPTTPAEETPVILPTREVSPTATSVASATPTTPAEETPVVLPTQAASSTPTPFPSISAQPTIDLAPPSDVPEQVLNAARTALAAHLGIAENTLMLASSTAMQWNDGSLGCPDPSMGYTQAIVPGYLLVFNDGSQDHAIHTSVNGTPLILCQNGMPEILPVP